MNDREEREHFREVLIETNTILKQHIQNFDRYTDRVEEEIIDHKKEDKEHFDRLYGMVGSIREFKWKSTGAMLAVSVLFGAIPTIVLLIRIFKK